MFRLLFFALLVIILGVLGSRVSGYIIHFGNIPYYLQFEQDGARHEVLFKNGRILKGAILEETSETIRLNTDGAVATYKKSEIKSVKTFEKIWLLTDLQINYEKHHKIHPLISHDESQTLRVKLDSMITEPSRSADEIRAKNPQLASESGAMLQALQLQVRAEEKRAKTEA